MKNEKTVLDTKTFNKLISFIGNNFVYSKVFTLIEDVTANVALNSHLVVTEPDLNLDKLHEEDNQDAPS